VTVTGLATLTLTISRATENNAAGSSSASAHAAGTVGFHGLTAGILTPAFTQTGDILFIVDGGGSAITTGVKGDVVVDFDCSISRQTLVADVSGSIVIDIWKDTYANFPPTVADTITASAKPTLSAATKAQDSTLTGWTKAITAGDTLRFNVDSASTVTRVTLVLRVART